MARWYATFDGSSVQALQDLLYEQVSISNGSTLRAALISTRAALSAAAYAQINSGNQNGTLGIVVPTDVVTRGGGNYSWTNLYQNVAAEWPSDPRVRPTAQILSTDPASSAVSPTDAGTISDTLYTDAQTALENCFTAMTGGGPRGRIGQNPWRTLASIFHDHGLAYLAWDDFTPGTAQGVTIGPSTGFAGSYQATLAWTDYQFANDENASGAVRVLMGLQGTQSYSFDSGWITPPAGKSVTWILSSPAPVAGTYTLDGNIRIRDAVISDHVGVQANATPITVTIS
jgi:hypothetical protein